MATSVKDVTPNYFAGFAMNKVMAYIRKSGYIGELHVYPRFDGIDRQFVRTSVDNRLYEVIRDRVKDEIRLIVHDEVEVIIL